MLDFSELDLEENKILMDAVFSAIAEFRKSSVEEFKLADSQAIMADVFASWGVMCLHPFSSRLYDGSRSCQLPDPKAKWYYCPSCGCRVINEARDRGETRAGAAR